MGGQACRSERAGPNHPTAARLPARSHRVAGEPACRPSPPLSPPNSDCNWGPNRANGSSQAAGSARNSAPHDAKIAQIRWKGAILRPGGRGKSRPLGVMSDLTHTGCVGGSAATRTCRDRHVASSDGLPPPGCGSAAAATTAAALRAAALRARTAWAAATAGETAGPAAPRPRRPWMRRRPASSRPQPQPGPGSAPTPAGRGGGDRWRTSPRPGRGCRAAAGSSSTSKRWSHSTRVTTRPSSPARAVRPERWR